LYNNPLRADENNGFASIYASDITFVIQGGAYKNIDFDDQIVQFVSILQLILFSWKVTINKPTPDDKAIVRINRIFTVNLLMLVS